VCTAEDLNNVRANLNGEYIQTCDIDMSNYTTWTPLGGYSSHPASLTPFSGMYNGAGHTIYNFTYYNLDSPDLAVGLFGEVNDEGFVRNVNLVNFNVTVVQSSVSQAGTYVGSLFGLYDGRSTYPAIENITVQGSIRARTPNGFAGGVVGDARFTEISNMHSNVTIYREFTDKVLSGANSAYVGGIAGISGSIRNSSAVGNIHSYNFVVANETPLRGAGGLATYVSGSIEKSYVEMNIIFDSSPSGGGLGGLAMTVEKNIVRSGFKGTLSGNSSIGGVAALVYGNVSETFAKGNITGNRNIGGLISSYSPEQETQMTDSYARVNIFATGQNIGGLVYETSTNRIVINRSYAAGNITGVAPVGGLIGYTSQPAAIVVSNSYWDVNVSGRNSSFGGGSGNTTDQMLDQNTYLNWDFTNVWEIAQNGPDYPHLVWEQGVCGPLRCSPFTTISELRESKLFSKRAGIVLGIHALLFVIIILSIFIHIRHEKRDALLELRQAFPEMQEQTDPYLTGQ
jgi:hypothetical protein